MEEAGLRKAPKGSSLLKHTAKRGRAAEAGGGTEAKVHQWDVGFRWGRVAQWSYSQGPWQTARV